MNSNRSWLAPGAVIVDYRRLGGTLRIRTSTLLSDFRRRLGRFIAGLGHANTDTFFECLVNIGFEPQHVVDIGAHRGGWTRSAMKYFPAARYTLFEPQRELLEAQADLERANVTRVYAGVGPETGTQKLTSHERPDSYSFAWSEEEASSEGRKQVEMEVVSLDDYLASKGNALPPPDIIKIDAEGWDLEVLKGAATALSTTQVVLMEAGVMNKQFKNTVQRVINAMAELDFALFDVTDLNRTVRDRGLWNVELAFVRAGGPLEAAVDRYE